MSTDPPWTDLCEIFPLHWQMTRCEKFAFVSLLERIRPQLSIEIGTYQGGSLQVIDRYSDRTTSIDINPRVKERLAEEFPNVDFQSGPSEELVPRVISNINDNRLPVEFVLIDGDHSKAGVKRDIESVLQLVPQRRITIILHDSFNPSCRAGMREANWASSPHVHYVELDFIPGIFHKEAFDTAEAGSMWGGFACAILEPKNRSGPLDVKESQRGIFETVLPASCHSGHSRSSTNRILNKVLSRLSRSTS